MTAIFGIDPGVHGAIAVLDEGGDLLEVVDMPSTPEANGRSATNAPLLAGILARTHARIAFCEFVGARPTDAKVAAFAFGREQGYGPYPRHRQMAGPRRSLRSQMRCRPR
jgi:crossover junction endodeoxyribonuclease RuvC